MTKPADAPFGGRAVLLAGATGAVGAAVLARLAAQGALIAATVQRPWQVARIEQTLAEHGVGPERRLVAAVGTDDGEAAAGMVKGVEDALGPIAALISAAGAFAAAPYAAEASDAATTLWQANLGAIHNLARAVVPPMRRRHAGSIAVVGARAALSPDLPSGMALYLASKAALHTWVRALAAELAADGIRVRAVAPGVIDTAANRAAMPDADRSSWLAVDQVALALLQAAAVDGPAVTAI